MQVETKNQYVSELINHPLTSIAQVKLSINGVMTEESLKEAVSEKSPLTTRTIAFIKGGNVEVQEDDKLMKFFKMFGGAKYRGLMENYSKIFTSNIKEDEYKTLAKLNDFAEYLMEEEDVCKLQRENGVKFFAESGNFEVRMNYNNAFQPFIIMTKNNKTFEWVAKNSAHMENILGLWFADEIKNSIAFNDYTINS